MLTSGLTAMESFASHSVIQSQSKSRELALLLLYWQSVFRDITNFLNREDIRAMLGVDSTIGNFSSCNNEVNAQFNANLDSVYPTPHYVTGLLERGVNVLVYVGANDFRCNWVRHSFKFSLLLSRTRSDVIDLKWSDDSSLGLDRQGRIQFTASGRVEVQWVCRGTNSICGTADLRHNLRRWAYGDI